MIAICVSVVVFCITVFIYLKQDKFGKISTGERLSLIRNSPNYKDGKFVNQIELPVFSKGHNMWTVTRNSLFTKYERTEPTDSIPSQKNDLKSLPIDSNLIVWFGHSSLYMHFNGKRILIDPIFSGNASPVPGSVKAFRGADIYDAEEIPEIDYLIISHDHYDHLDYETLLALKDKVKHVVCGLGVGAHFELWGYDVEKIFEKDWYQKVDPGDGIVIHTLPAHHASGRTFNQAQSLWLSFVLESPAMKIYYSGDGGYDPVFKEIGDKFGPIDLSILECGQYNVAWQSVHKLPHQVMEAAVDLKSKRMMPVHHSKFALSNHAWDEPLKKISEFSKGKNYQLVTPMIGEVVWLNNKDQVFKSWWKTIN